MDYTSKIIRGLTDASLFRRPLVIADSSKLDGGASVYTLRTTARELGLDYHIVQGIGENEQDTKYLIAGMDEMDVVEAAVMIRSASMAGVSGGVRDHFQRTMGKLLGYSEEDIDSFIGSEIAQSCACACCGGKAQ